MRPSISSHLKLHMRSTGVEDVDSDRAWAFTALQKCREVIECFEHFQIKQRKEIVPQISFIALNHFHDTLLPLFIDWNLSFVVDVFIFAQLKRMSEDLVSLDDEHIQVELN